MSKWLKISAATVATGVTAAVAASVAVYHNLTHISDSEKEKGHHKAVSENTAADNVWYLKQPIQEWRQTTPDGLTLRASYIPAAGKSLRVVILAHSINHAREQMIPLAKLFHDHGYNVLMPDARAQGQSDGHRIGFGWPDRKDYLGWIEKVISELGDNVKIVLMGLSMGAATVLATAGEHLPQNVKAVVADSGFASIYQMAKTTLRRDFHLPANPIVPIADWLARFRTGSRLSQERVDDQLKRAMVPVLIIHGEDDQVVPVKHAKVLYEAIKGPKKAYIVPHAKHIQAYAHDPEHYQQVLSDFLSQYV
ncbi:alpha/beta fold hydrolase [Lactobacillus sp. LC28-10]|uniref:Alpha/beta fold hydrolase n=1 Tax=Secundilactobacillus angelensis TaxID=2722706 RepID=A0ABX1L078_9LACO|nr:alpha/beta fold hydrolase [Secundilactobacillus angelensis]MCH5463058.1 alpha/beta fold hydrolase [Secundilactobacillus angelensis]NLR18865.1 alpha/beta fold hydrolase [Secundilactobacillus angelensis]